MEEEYRVLIVGAGIAGLSCAKYLHEHGIEDFLLVEARTRPGGRCQTVFLGDQVMELGAAEVEGETSNNPLYQLAEDYHLADIDDSGSDRDECYHDEDVESIDEDIVDEMRRIYDEILEKKVPTYPYENYPDLSLGEFISAEFEQYFQINTSNLDSEEIDQRRKVLHWLDKQHPYLNTIACNKLADVSVQGWNYLERLPKDADHLHEKVYLRQGFTDFIDRVLLKKIPRDRIQFNSIVKRIAIQEEEQCVHVEIFDQINEQTTNYRVQHVVCTQSVGCLKQTMHQVFVPALPHAKRMCIQRLGFGTINKIYLIFSKPFWDVDFDAFHFLWDVQRLNTELKLKCFAQTSYDSHWCKAITGFTVHPRLSNVLMTEIRGEAAKYIENIPDDLLANAFQELLCHFYPDNPSPPPKQLIRSRWFNEPFIHGSHTYIKLGSSIHDIKQLALPWPNKPEKPLILFAGEGTHERFYGTAHGAYLTGIREGKRLIDVYKTTSET